MLKHTHQHFISNQCPIAIELPYLKTAKRKKKQCLRKSKLTTTLFLLLLPLKEGRPRIFWMSQTVESRGDHSCEPYKGRKSKITPLVDILSQL